MILNSKNLLKTIFLMVLILGMANAAHAGSLSMTTYYPAPFGAYDRIRLVPRATLVGACDIGTMYVDTSGNLRFCQDVSGTGVWGPLGSAWIQNGNNVSLSDSTNVNLKVGVGTAAPTSTLTVDYISGTGVMDVLGSAGSTLFVGDNNRVGVRTTTPTSELDINGQITIRGGTPGAGKVLTSDGVGTASWTYVTYSP